MNNNNKKYHSFLICDHGTHIDVYLTGMPLGQVRDGKFIRREIILSNGEKVPFEITQVPNSPFQNLSELAASIETICATMREKDAEESEILSNGKLDTELKK